MRIATLTLPLHTNYGGVMQAYALQQVLINLGCEAELLQLTPSIRRPWYRVVLSKVKFVLNKVVSLGRYYGKHGNKNFSRFISNEISCTKKIEFSGQLDSVEVQAFDAYIVGSDQVWRADYAGYVESYFFDFVKGECILLSYASSFGVDSWDYSEDQRSKCTALLQKFKAVSVREETAVALCAQYLSVIAERLLDPTMLLERKQYEHLIPKYSDETDHEPSEVFAYILDFSDFKLGVVGEVSRLLGGRAVVFNQGRVSSEKKGFGDWLKGFRDSRFIVTDSFHGVAFSIIFNKPFVAIGNVSRGLSRFETVLKVFGLTDRLLLESGNVEVIVNSGIDYENVNRILNSEKSRSVSYLKGALSID